MKRILSVILAFCLVFSTVPVCTFAQEAAPSTPTAAPDAVVKSDNVSVSATNNLGTLLADEIDQHQDAIEQEEESSGGYVLLGLTVEGSTATVSFETLEAAVLVVSLYTEDGAQMLSSGKTNVAAEDTEATVAIEGTVPNYFMATAFLLDTYDYSPLCQSYTTPMYTQEMQNLLASTAEDYDADRVRTLSEDTSTNFVVYHDDTLVISGQEEVNKLISADDENKLYVFENADSTITGLKAGTVIAYEFSADDVLVVKIASVAVDGTTATVTGQDVELEEAFAFMKLEQAGDAGGIVPDESQPAEDGVIFGGIEEPEGPATRGTSIDISSKFSLKFDFEKDLVNQDDATVKVGAHYNLTVDVHLAFYVSVSKRFVEFKIDTMLEGEFSAEGKIDKKLGLGVYTLPLYGISVGIAPELHLTFTGKIAINLTVKTTLGFVYESGSGIHNLCKAPTIEKPDWNFEGTVFVGIDLCPTIRLLQGSVAKLDIHVPIGFELKGELYINPHYENLEDYEGTIHHCEKCIEMKLYFKIAPKVEIKFLNCDFFSIEWEMLGVRSKLADMYFNLDKLEFGTGHCPNKSFRVTVSAENAENKAVQDAVVVYDEAPFTYDNAFGTTNENGVAVLYMPSGTYTFRTCFDGSTYEYTHFIQQAGKVVLGPNVKNGRHFFAEKVNPADYVDEGAILGSGECGDGVTWTLYESGHMWIDGCGTMTDWTYDYKVPWHYKRDRIKRVIINDEVENVGRVAFCDCPNLTDVYLGDAVTVIGAYAFDGSHKLKNINFPDKLVTIDKYAFLNCRALEEATVPKGVTTIGDGAFCYTLNLKKFYYNAENANAETVHTQIFDCSGIESGGVEVIIDAGVTRIPNYLFGWGSYSSTHEYLKLKSVTFEEGSQCKEIGDYAFYISRGNCELILPEGLEVIGKDAFREAQFTSIYIPGTVTTIGDYAFYHCDSLAEVTLPASLTSLGKCVFGSCDVLKKATFNGGITEIPYHTFSECPALEEVNLTDGITTIGEQAFSHCTSLKEISLPSSVTLVDEKAFSNCTALTAVKLSKNLKTIDRYAFEYCSALKEVVIPDSVTSLGKFAFSYNTSMTSFYLGSGVTSLTTDIIQENHSLMTLEVSPDNSKFTSIGNCIIQKSNKTLFLGCAGSVIPNDGSVKSIGSYAFAYNDGVTEMPIPSKVTTISSYAFYDCDGLKSAIIPDTVTSLGTYAFYDCDSLEIATIGNGISTVQTSLFRSCDSLKTVTLGSKVKKLNNNAFSDCTALESVTLNEGLQTIDGGVFVNCTSLQSIVLPNSLTSMNYSGYSLKSQTFSGCTSLKSVTIGTGLTVIPDYAFYNCTSLEQIIIPDNVTAIEDHAFYNCTGLQKVDTGNGVTTIEGSAFSGCTSLTDITFGSSVTTIDASAFADCTGLQKIVIPDTVTSIGSSIFNGCTALSDVTIGSGITVISSNAFYGCTGLEQIDIPDTVTEIGSYAFYGCTNLSFVDFGSGLTTIGDYAFRGTAFLVLFIPDNVTSIGSYAFAYCPDLINVTFGQGLTTLGSRAFAYNEGLCFIRFRGNAPSIGSSCFYDATAQVQYPIGNDTWTSSIMTNYGGTLTWTAFDPNAQLEQAALTAPTKAEKTAEIAPAAATPATQTAPQPAESVEADQTQTETKPATRAVFPGNQESVVETNKTTRTATFTDLVPGQEYVMLALVSMEVDDLLAADNILYIYQAAADENGTLTVSYIQRVTTGETYIMACGASDQNLKDAQIIFPAMGADDALQAVDPVVIYGEEELTEGEDYIIVGTVDYTAAGQYTCYIRGIYDYTGMVTCSYTVRSDIATEHKEEWDRVTLLEDAALDLTLTNDLYLDLAGHDMTGTIITGEHTLYVMDSTTDQYSADNIGYFNCVDENGEVFVPQQVSYIGKEVAGKNMKYVALLTEEGYSFHRFYLDITHMNIKPSETGVGYKAVFCGDDMVIAALNPDAALGYQLTLEGGETVARHLSVDKISSGQTIVLRLINYDVANYGETKLHVQAQLQFADGTCIDSKAYSYSLREIVELVNKTYKSYSESTLTALAAMIATYPNMQSWNVSNITG